jgi:pyruvate dehydrogenase E2 component (dihydrolipoamide acetyltransferase)
VKLGETLCEVETDKATMEVESTAEGTILALLYKNGDEVPVMVNIAVVGAQGEDIQALLGHSTSVVATSVQPAEPVITSAPITLPILAQATPTAERRISPRARNLALRKQVEWSTVQGTGPEGRIIERDIQAALASATKLTPVAQSMVRTGEFIPPERASGTNGWITKKDLIPVQESAPVVATTNAPSSPPLAISTSDDVEVIPLKGTRKIIATRMLASLQTTAQLTLNSTADARGLQAHRKRLKASPAEWGLQSVTLNDMILFAVARTLPKFLELNGLFQNNAIYRHRAVHLGMAVDTDRGLIVPVIRQADQLSLKALATEAHRLAAACLNGTITADELAGGTFTVTNLGSLGIESFTPVLNAPQLGILGVGSIVLKPVEIDDAVQFIPHLGLSLTIDHQVVDGAPGARFLQTLSQNLAQIELLLSQ